MGNKIFELFLIFFILFFCALNSVRADDFDDDFSVFEAEMLKSKTRIYDPLEPLNRKIFTFNEFAEKYAVGYVIDGYRFIFPQVARNVIGNFFTNLSKPFSFLNSAAQGKTDNALASLSSFVINSTIGLFGIIDVAGSEEVNYNNETLGQTLGYYGVKNGAYLVLPFLGPATVREFSSNMTESAISPIGFDIFSIDDKMNIELRSEERVALNALNAIDKRERLSDLLEETKKGSFDYYATVRSYYLQNIQSKVNE